MINSLKIHSNVIESDTGKCTLLFLGFPDPQYPLHTWDFYTTPITSTIGGDLNPTVNNEFSFGQNPSGTYECT